MARVCAPNSNYSKVRMSNVVERASFICVIGWLRENIVAFRGAKVTYPPPSPEGEVNLPVFLFFHRTELCVDKAITCRN